MLSIPTVAAKQIVTQMGSTTATFLGDVQLRLYKNAGLVITPATAKADLTEADFDGYAAGVETVALTFNAAANDPQGNGLLIGHAKTWISTGDSTPNTIYGVFGIGLGADSVTLKFIEATPNPAGIAIGKAGDFVSYTLRFPYPGPVSGLFDGP